MSLRIFSLESKKKQKLLEISTRLNVKVNIDEDLDKKKICVYCKQLKNLEFFNKSNKNFDGYVNCCVVCLNPQTAKSINKICPQCNLTKNLTNFYFDKKNFVYQNICKSCAYTKLIERRVKEKKINEQKKQIKYKEWNPTNETRICKFCFQEKSLIDFKYHKSSKYFSYRCSECRREKMTKYTELNREKLLSRKKEYHSKNKEIIRTKKKIYYENNKEKIKRKVDLWRKNNPEKYQISRKRYLTERWNSDENYRLRKLLSHRLREAIKRDNIITNSIKKCSILKYIGCDLDFFIKYVEQQFILNMSWKNSGKMWELDHLLPCELFDFSNEDQIRLCFNYTNFQPLIENINYTKNDYLPDGRRAKSLLSEEKEQYIKESFNENGHLRPEIIQKIKEKWPNS